jgi:hypothetical protein
MPLFSLDAIIKDKARHVVGFIFLCYALFSHDDE